MNNWMTEALSGLTAFSKAREEALKQEIDLELNNQDAPAFKKENPSLFKPYSTSQKLRQAIYNILRENPKACIKLTELARLTKSIPTKARTAAKQLVKHGFATKHDIEEASRSKKNPENKVKRVALKFVEPWHGKKNAEW